MITGKNYIGHHLSAEGTVSFKTLNPMSNTNNDWEMIEATPEEIKEACRLAQSTFKDYRSKSNEERALFLESIADEIEELGDVLLDTYMKESGLPKGRAQGERGRTINQLKAFATMLRSDWNVAEMYAGDLNRQPLPKPELIKKHLPIGPVAVFGASNFPLAFSTAGGDTASALAAGCPVVVKSHPMHAGTGELVASAIVKAAQKTDMPSGVFSHLNSSGIDVGQQLVQAPEIKGVGFTGSIKGGRALYDLAAKRDEPIPVFAEMGSINPVVISPEALKKKGDSWAASYAGSITLGTGQFCTNPGLILGIESKELSAFSKKLDGFIQNIEVSCMLHSSIKENYNVKRNEILSQTGVDTLSELNEVKGNQAASQVVNVSGKTFLNNPKLHQEVFGPFSMIVACADEAELIEVIDSLEGQLTGTILAEKEEIEALKPIVESLQYRVGRLVFNGVPTGVEVSEGMHHGGPYPASTDARYTSVGLHAVNRWVRPIAYQNIPQTWLPK